MNDLEASAWLRLHAPADAAEAPTTQPLDRRPRILKQGDLFALFDAHGDVDPTADAGAGLYLRDARRLSKLRLTLAGRAPVLLNSTVSIATGMLDIHLTNPDIVEHGRLILPRDVVHLRRSKYLSVTCSRERIALRNFGFVPLELDVDLFFDVDFADIFEARGFRRDARGAVATTVDGADAVRFVYDSADDEPRATRLTFSPAPHALGPRHARWRVRLAPQARASLFATVDCTGDGSRVDDPAFFHGLRAARRTIHAVARRSAVIETGDAIADEVFARARADLTMLTTETADGAYPFAGVPWFSTPFGRDGLITAWLTLWADPSLARGVLRYLSAAQASLDDAATDAEPGKILHETRSGELSNLGFVPFRRYFGAVDTTPLFVALAGDYLERTGDLETIRQIAPSIDRALDWIDRHGDRDADGFVEYHRRRPDGLRNQGWKDSDDSIHHADGRLADGPIALVEVQGYVCAAQRAGAKIARALGDPARAAALEAAAKAMAERIEAHYWDDALGFYAMALDGEKRPCCVRSSNAGHLLFAGVARPEHARAVAEALMQPAFFTGFGIRTLAAGEARYNPMSYHNGSVWPHDTAMIALGMARYNFNDLAARLLGGMLDTAAMMDLRRLPELFCGFRHAPGAPPTPYPVACAPQAWAAAAPFGLVSAALGLSIDAASRAICLTRPALPKRLSRLSLKGARLGDTAVDLHVRRVGDQVSVDAERRAGDIEVRIQL